MLGLGLSIPQVAARGSRSLVAAIRSLFAANEPGVWYDPSDLSTLYQDSAGTTPVTAVEQPVGLMLDKSKRPVLGPELVTNGTFDTDLTGWTPGDFTASINWVSGGYVNVKMLANTGSGARQDVALESGWVKVSIRARKVGTSGNTMLVLYGYGAFNLILGQSLITSQSFQNYDFVVPATNGGFRVYLKVEFSGAEMEVDSVSVRELPGNHAYQTTATSRPVLSARVNLLTKTEDFDDVVWAKGPQTLRTANAAIAPDGTLSAEKIYETATAGQHEFLQSFTATASVIYTASVYVKKAERSFAYVGLYVGSPRYTALFNLETGTLERSWTGTGETNTGYSVSSTGNGWWRITVSAAFSSDATCFFVTGPANSNNPPLLNGRPSYAGDGTSGIYIWGADLRVANDGANLPPYQRVNTETDYDTAGFPHYLRFDGVDDWLVTNTITPGIDKAQVFAGVRKLSDAVSWAQVCELSANGDINNGTFELKAPASVSASIDYSFYSRGSVLSLTGNPGVFLAPITNVLTGLGDISGDSVILRINGAQAAQSTTDQGTGNYLAYPLYIGRRGGTSYPFNGQLYGLIVRFGSNLPTATIENTENYVNQKTGAY